MKPSSLSPHYKLQHQLLGQSLFGQVPPDTKAHVVLNEIAGVCLREIYQAHFEGRSDLAKLQWQAKPLDSDFKTLQLAFHFAGWEAPRLPTTKNIWDLAAFYHFLRKKKLKQSRIRLWKALAFEMHLPFPREIKFCSPQEVKDQFNAWINDHNGFPFLVGLYLKLPKSGILPPEIGRLRSLRILTISGNDNVTLTPEIGRLHFLTMLEIKQSGLTTLIPEIFQLKALNTLIIRDHHLRAIPSEIARLQNIEYLNLDCERKGNGLKSLPPEIGLLQSLRFLAANRNQIARIPPEIGQLPSLRHLLLSDNQITTLPKELNELGARNDRLPPTVNLTGNPIKCCPSELSDLYPDINMTFTSEGP